jgi:hypothetical protein
MSNLEGKVICNAFMECDDKDHAICEHRIPHELHMYCRTACGSAGVPGGICVPIQVCYRVNGELVYCIKGLDGKTHMIPKDFAPAIPDFNMDEKIYICPAHTSCPNPDCIHKQFHNRSAGCISECYYCGVRYGYNCNEGCREANSEEILQLFRDHEGENQHIDDMIKRDDQIYLDAMDEPTKPKPEKPKPTHERVQRFLNLEL